ncbi:UDP-glycosyltransferase 75C1 [Nicotiana tabacum]|uniref:Glycosyltransferase n=1 Tax=Nicotiana tabacum TaxID=4097 RepID=A0A1S3Y177_TOBAC|nr:PREDICTED: crocetin glucosyltransferase, chloroplastic-like [Nicotiana tabacum]
MAKLKDNCHVLLVTFPSQGQINPSLQFAKRLIKLGVNVTFSTSLSALNCISNNLPSVEGLTLAPFSDGYDNGYPNVGKSLDEYREFYASFIALGSEFVSEIFTDRAKEGRPFSRIIYTAVLSWVGIVARRLNAPATLLWIQPATLLDIYYYYFTSYKEAFKNCPDEDKSLEIPGLPFFVGTREIPSFLLSSNGLMDWLIQTIKEHIELINSESNEIVLVNTFDALEFEALRAIKNVNMVGIGPLIPSAFLDGNPSDTSYGGDLRQCSKDYMEWLNSKPNASVVYVAFGSYTELPKQMMEEIAQGLLQSERPFLWVVNGENTMENLSCKEELEKQGKIVSWCSQVEVLQHPSLGCFLTHCGWNSTLESLVSGIPVVACPLWTDQGCNSKLIQDVWKTGVRVNVNEDGFVEGAEFKRCIEIVMADGKEGEELRKNAKKWRDSAKDTIKEDGSSNVNLKAYVDEVLNSHA